MDLVELIRHRRSIRKFEDREVASDLLDPILWAANRAPTAGNLQAFRVAVVRAPEARAALARAALDQACIAGAPVVLVFFADPAASATKYGARGRSLYAVQDATIACSYAQLAAENLGLGSCWVGAFREGEVNGALGVDPGLVPVALLAVGHAEEGAVTSRRRPAEMLVEPSL